MVSTLAGTRSTRPRAVSTRSTRTATGSPIRTALPVRSPRRIVPSSLRSYQSSPQPPHRQHPLEAVAEGDEGARADDADDLALEDRLEAGLEEHTLEQERRRDVVGRAR